MTSHIAVLGVAARAGLVGLGDLLSQAFQLSITRCVFRVLLCILGEVHVKADETDDDEGKPDDHRQDDGHHSRDESGLPLVGGPPAERGEAEEQHTGEDGDVESLNLQRVAVIDPCPVIGPQLTGCGRNFRWVQHFEAFLQRIESHKACERIDINIKAIRCQYKTLSLHDIIVSMR